MEISKFQAPMNKSTHLHADSTGKDKDNGYLLFNSG